MSLIKKMLKFDVCTWWPQSRGAPDDFGQPIWTPPAQIQCRWADEIKEFVAKDGTRQTSTAIVYVDRDMQIGDLLTHLPLAGLVNSDPQNAKLNPDTFEVRQFQKLPNLHKTEYLRTVYL